ncbi:MAG TPA: hypothetical protein VFZ65_07310 [Planctomycetota bacterium]|nr:hypothetical protein [Planctomycetota bacterium]
MATRFELLLEPSGKFHFLLRSPDGGVLLRSLAGDSKIMSQNELLHARNALRDDSRLVPHEAEDGSHFLVVKDRDGSVLARSPSVGSAAELEAMTDQIRAAGQGAPVIDLTKRRAQGA